MEDEILKARRRRVILESQNAADTRKLQRLEAGQEAEEDLDATALSLSPASLSPPPGLGSDAVSALGLSLARRTKPDSGLSPVLSDVSSDGGVAYAGASPTHLPPTPTGTADRLLANRAGSPGEGLAPRLSLADVTVGGAADKIIVEIEALREAIAMTRVQNEEIAQTARREAEIYRAQLKQALQERDQAHDHLLLLKQKWLEGYDELGQEFDLTEIGAEYQSQVKLIQHHHRLMDFANLELTTLRQSRKSTTDGLQESLVVLDAQHQTTLADLSDLRRAKTLSSKVLLILSSDCAPQFLGTTSFSDCAALCRPGAMFAKGGGGFLFFPFGSVLIACCLMLAIQCCARSASCTTHPRTPHPPPL